MKKQSSTVTGTGCRLWRYKNLALSVALLPALLSGCTALSLLPLADVLVKSEPAEQFHPPLPNPVVPPAEPEIVVITPEVCSAWNEEIADGKRLPYSMFSVNDQDYLTQGQYMTDVLRYIRELNSVVEYYRKGRQEPPARSQTPDPAR